MNHFRYRKILIASVVFLFIVIAIYLIILNKYSVKDDYGYQYKTAEALLKESEFKNSIYRTSMPMREDVKENRKVFDKGNIKLVQEEDFEDVAGKQKDMATMLIEKMRERKKTYVKLDEDDTRIRINLADEIEKNKKINTNYVPPPDMESSRMTPVYAPCDYKIFKSSSQWNEFIKRYMVRGNYKEDFSNSYLLTIVSRSELPPGIFVIDSVKKDKNGNLTVYYRVNVLELSSENPDSKREFYSVINIPRDIKSIKLVQIQ